jgi:hypothetical protein
MIPRVDRSDADEDPDEIEIYPLHIIELAARRRWRQDAIREFERWGA